MSTEARRRLARLIHCGRLALVVAIVWQLTLRASQWDGIVLAGTGEANWLTSPEGDEVMGWAGPTTLALGVDNEGRVESAAIVSSADSASYVESIEKDLEFLPSLIGLQRHELGRWSVDAVSGATLTSRAIQGAVRLKFGGAPPPSPFPSLELEPSVVGARVLQGVYDSAKGYQGPTQVLLEVGPDDHVVRVLLGETFDNEPYFSDVRDDYTFLKSFVGMSLDELRTLQVGRGGVEGVSGATMTSQGVAQSLRDAALQDQIARRASVEPSVPKGSLVENSRQLLGWMVGGAALLILLSPLRRVRRARMALRIGVVLGFGVGAGALLSLDALWSWSRYGLPWQTAPVLAGFVLAALIGPALLGRKTYCRSLCAHGALQQLLAGKARGKLAPKLDRFFRRAPSILLIAAVVLLLLASRTANGNPELAGWEPFSAWTPQTAAMGSLVLAALSIAASAWVPLAYCHYGCPTGALLGYLQLQPSRALRPADVGALVLLLAVVTI